MPKVKRQDNRRYFLAGRRRPGDEIRISPLFMGTGMKTKVPL